MPTLSARVNGQFVQTSRTGSIYIGPAYDVLYFTDTRPDRDTDPKPKVFREPKAYSLSIFKQKKYYASAYYDTTKTTVKSRVGWNPSEVQLDGLADDPSLVNEALIKALLKLKDQKINVGVALAEAMQTANLVHDVANRIRHAYKLAGRADFRGAARQLGLTVRETPQNWLAVQYGVKPLLSDVHGAIQALQFQPSYAWLTHVEGVAKRDAYENSYLRDISWSIEARETIRRNAVAKVGLWYKPRNSLLTSLSKVGMTNLAEVAWEKVPASFIADWFIPIGDWLSAMDAAFGYEFVAGYGTYFAKAEGHGTIIGPKPGSLCTAASGLDASSKRVYMKRRTYSSSPLPSVPEFNQSPLSFGRAVNALALLFAAVDRPVRYSRPRRPPRR